MEKEMSWKQIFDLLHPSRNQNNVIQFPGKENKEVRKQKNDLVVLTLTIEKLMNAPGWDVTPITTKAIEQLAQFGETISFSPITSQRLIACLCTELIKHRLDNTEDPY